MCGWGGIGLGSSDTPPKSIAKMRQFHSHHNLLSLVQPSTQLQSDEQELQGGKGLPNPGLQFSLQPQEDTSQPQSLKERSVWVRQGSSTSNSEDSKQPSNFWDFFTGKVSGSETIVWPLDGLSVVWIVRVDFFTCFLEIDILP